MLHKTLMAIAAAAVLGCVPVATNALAAGHPAGRASVGHAAAGGHPAGGRATQSLVVVILSVPAVAPAMDRLALLRSMTVATDTTRAMATMDAPAMVFPLSAA